ncbi:hypothetical protein CRI77_06405 [Mycolicibacterium duvalii]|uniref:Membrane protein n=1 Tax=Mycolicibacterium duvalii TaxID=39688 RepID=A0A7I7K6S6_9MYCO|nr:DUF2975 domain-containing protein [Mycolicibacterium duvalii]MCV7368142.1 DUF2975 domain-containing protein [Mycolicibacterium duvalii]PEG43368.1 hypothetical protein CRI77_06405 [Mycolicibacterium duvalii]BBX19795.1 membrane protein [Mycolicibacterium duvalii]
MIAVRRVLPLLKLTLVALFGVLVLLQTMSLPGQFAHMAAESPEQAHLRWPLTAVSVFLVLCVEVVVVCTWKLLTLVRSDRIFRPVSLVWVDVIIGAIATGWTVFLALFLYVGFRATDPGLPLLMFLALTGGAVLGLVMVVMRALLQQATALRTDLDAVI